MTTYVNGRVFDGERLLENCQLTTQGRVIAAMGPDLPRRGEVVDLGGDILAPGYVDLQVNGGGGVLLNDAPSVETLRRIAGAHRALGTRALLPTLITDRPEVTRAAIAAAVQAVAEGVPGIAGLHLEGPHLSLARKGAHDPALIRAMTDDDLALLLDAARALPVLNVTVAPENVTEAQVAALAQAGVLVSLGHSDCDFETACRYVDAGARGVTHLFNAMSGLGHRAPGLVGAALARGEVHAGLIADGVHVHPAAMGAAWRAKRGPGRIFLVSDAMAVAGTDLDRFTLNGREITRRDGVLTLEDGTLAGADLDLTRAVRVLHEQAGVPLAEALRAATRTPAELIGLDSGRIVPGETRTDDMIRIRADLSGLVPL